MNLPNGNRCSIPAIHGSTLDDVWYIQYNFYPATIPDDWPPGKTYKRVILKFDLNKINNLKERRQQANTLLTTTINLLKNGASPITKTLPANIDYEISPDTGFVDALYIALEQADFVHNHYLTIKSMCGMISTAAMAIGTYDFKIGQITIKEVMATLNRACVNKSNKTFNRYRKDLSSLFKILVPLVGISNPCRDIPKKGTVTEVRQTLDRKERKRVDRHLKKKGLNTFRLFNRIFFTSGCRITELLSVKVDDIDLKNQWFLVTIKKGKQQRQVRKTIGNTAILYWRYALRNASTGNYLFGRRLKPNDIQITAPQITARWQRHVKETVDKGGLGITVDYYPAHKHAAATYISDKYGHQAAADHMNHTSDAMVKNIYDLDGVNRRHEEAKKRKVIY